LIDKTQTPRFEVVKDGDYPETVILKFIAGPPYEAIAFRIVNREWDVGYRKTYKSTFDRGVLQLHFRFKVI
jgi:hypothetical protein